MKIKEYSHKKTHRSFAGLLELLQWDLESTTTNEGDRLSVAKGILQEIITNHIHCSYSEENELLLTIEAIDSEEGIGEVSTYLEAVYLGEATLSGKTTGTELKRIMYGKGSKSTLREKGKEVIGKVRNLLHLGK